MNAQRRNTGQRQELHEAAARTSGLAHLCKGDLERAVPTLERGLGIARARSVSFMEPFLCSAGGSAYVQSGRIAEGISLLELGLGGATRVGLKAQVITLRGWLAAGIFWRSAKPMPPRWPCKSLEAARQVGHMRREADARSMLGHIAASAQPPQIEEAEGHYRAALTLAEPRGVLAGASWGGDEGVGLSNRVSRNRASACQKGRRLLRERCGLMEQLSNLRTKPTKRHVHRCTSSWRNDALSGGALTRRGTARSNTEIIPDALVLGEVIGLCTVCHDEFKGDLLLVVVCSSRPNNRCRAATTE